MIRSPDLRIVARRSNLSGSGSEDRAQWRVRVAPKTASLPAYSGGTVWDLHPLPLLIEQRRIDTLVYPTDQDRSAPCPVVSMNRLRME